MKSRTNLSVSSSVLAAAAILSMVIIPASGANTVPPPPPPSKNSPAIGNTSNQPSAASTSQTSKGGWRIIASQSLGVTSVLELDGAIVCLRVAGDDDVKVANFFSSNGMEIEPLAAEDIDKLRAALQNGACDVWALRASLAQNQLSQLNANGGDFAMLPETIQ